eukprot:scaffold51686_cov68-Phaeocystis_antarctica.AAC.1
MSGRHTRRRANPRVARQEIRRGRPRRVSPPSPASSACAAPNSRVLAVTLSLRHDRTRTGYTCVQRVNTATPSLRTAPAPFAARRLAGSAAGAGAACASRAARAARHARAPRGPRARSNEA